MLPTARQFAEIISSTLAVPEPIYEFGSLLVNGQEELSNLRPLFPRKSYIGCDMRKGPGVDIIQNLHKLNLPNESVGTVFIFDTLEHVEYPRQAIEEAYRILQPNGIIAISSVMKFPIHNFPNDYWRFTPEGFQSLLKIFRKSIIGRVGEDDFPISVFGIGFKGKTPSLRHFYKEFKHWQHFSTCLAKKIAEQEKIADNNAAIT